MKRIENDTEGRIIQEIDEEKVIGDMTENYSDETKGDEIEI